MSEKQCELVTVEKDGTPIPPIEDMKGDEVRAEIYRLLYGEEVPAASDPELLTITIRRDKQHLFDFLDKAHTEFPTVGYWHPPEDPNKPPEPNVQIDVQFWDIPSDHPQPECREAVGLRVQELLEKYNRLCVHEDVLYMRTVPIEESSL